MQNLFFHQAAIQSIRKQLLLRKETLAVAESVTSGLLQAAFSSADEAMNFFQGGMTAYNIGQKCRYFRIDPIHAIACDCVSGQIAEYMAKGVCELFSSQWGIGITGFATPVPQSGHQTFACYAICFNNEIRVSKTIEVRDKAPLDTQLSYVNAILDDLATECGG